MSLNAVNVVDEAIEIDEHELITNAIYTINFKNETYHIRREQNGKIYIFQTVDSYQDPPTNEGRKPWNVD